MVSRRFWDEIAEPGYRKMVSAIAPGRPMDDLRIAGQFFREKGVQSRPIHVHGIDFVSDGPHVFADHIDIHPFEETMKRLTTTLSEQQAEAAKLDAAIAANLTELGYGG